jgi:hypothetical protein
MSTAVVKSVVRDFLLSGSSEILAIKGAWGVGKTFAWNQMLRELKHDIKLEHYSYVSLFGITSIADLRIAILAKAIPVSEIGERISAKAINEHWLTFGKGLLSRSLQALKDTPLARNWAGAIDSIAPMLVGDALICIDDFERLNEKNLSSDALLGFISSLKEERGCKVVLIFNQEQLGDKEAVYKNYREKVVDTEVVFAPTLDESANLGISDSTMCAELVRRNCKSLHIGNIRILRKIARFIEIVAPHLTDFHKSVKEQAVTMIALFTWVHYDHTAKTPTIDFVRRWNTLAWQMEEKDKPSSPAEKEWAKLLRDFNLARIDEFDLAISDFVEGGHIEGTSFIDEAQKADAQYKSNDLDNSFSETWHLFHDSFDNNEQDLVQRMRESFKVSVSTISPVNLNGTVKLMRELGRNDIADELIEFYILKRGHEMKLFDLSSYPFRSDISDAGVLAAFEGQHSKIEVLPSLREAITNSIENSGWSRAEMKAIETASADDFYALFKMNHGKKFGTIVRRCLNFPNTVGIELRAREALLRIAKESRLNAVRVARFGVVVQSESTTASKIGDNSR